MAKTKSKPTETPIRFVTPARNTTVVLRAEQTLQSDGIVVKPLRIHFVNHNFTTSDPELIQMIRDSVQYGKYVYEVESSDKTKDRLIANKLKDLKNLGVDVSSAEGEEAEEKTETKTKKIPTKIYKHKDGTEFTSPLALYRYRVKLGEIVPKKKGKKKK